MSGNTSLKSGWDREDGFPSGSPRERACRQGPALAATAPPAAPAACCQPLGVQREPGRLRIYGGTCGSPLPSGQMARVRQGPPVCTRACRCPLASRVPTSGCCRQEPGPGWPLAVALCAVSWFRSSVWDEASAQPCWATFDCRLSVSPNPGKPTATQGRGASAWTTFLLPFMYCSSETNKSYFWKLLLCAICENGAQLTREPPWGELPGPGLQGKRWWHCCGCRDFTATTCLLADDTSPGPGHWPIPSREPAQSVSAKVKCAQTPPPIPCAARSVFHAAPWEGRRRGRRDAVCLVGFWGGPFFMMSVPQKAWPPPHAEWLLSASAMGQPPGTTPRAVITAGGLVGPEAPKPTRLVFSPQVQVVRLEP